MEHKSYHLKNDLNSTLAITKCPIYLINNLQDRSQWLKNVNSLAEIRMKERKYTKHLGFESVMIESIWTTSRILASIVEEDRSSLALICKEKHTTYWIFHWNKF